jgi:outer membrane lipoprotein LolB
VNRLRELLLILLLSGCAAIPPAGPPGTDTLTSAERAAIANWQFQGRVSLTRGEQGWHAGLNWENRADQYRLQVSGPLGQGALLLTGDAHGVTLVDGEGRVYTATDAEGLLQQVAGWQLPVSGLQYWVRGLSVPHASVEATRDAEGRLQQLVQSGWTITYQRYQDVAGSAWPSKMRLERDELAVRLVIDHWQLGLPGAPSL